MTCIDFTCHYHIYHTFNNWHTSIIPLLQLLVSSFQLKYIFLLSSWFIDTLLFRFYSSIHSRTIFFLVLSTHIFISNKCGDSISCCRSCLYLSPNQLPISSLLSPTLPYDFLSTTSWISPTFKTLSFSLITTKNPYYLLVSCSNCPTFHEQKSIL